VLAGTFAMLGTLPVTALAELGFAVAFGVLLDTIIVRSVLVTALNLDLGRRMWWPGKLARESARPAPEPEAAGDRAGRAYHEGGPGLAKDLLGDGAVPVVRAEQGRPGGPDARRGGRRDPGPAIQARTGAPPGALSRGRPRRPGGAGARRNREPPRNPAGPLLSAARRAFMRSPQRLHPNSTRARSDGG
jgi:hypothetical protein